MKKSSIIIGLFLAVIITELGVLFCDLWNSRKQNFPLDEVEYLVHERQVTVKPFLFEDEIGNRVQHVVEIIQREADSSSINLLRESVTSVAPAAEIDENRPLPLINDFSSAEMPAAPEPLVNGVVFNEPDAPLPLVEAPVAEVSAEVLPPVGETAVNVPEIPQPAAEMPVAENPTIPEIPAIQTEIAEPISVETIVMSEIPVNGETPVAAEENVVAAETPTADKAPEKSDKALIAIVLDDIGLSDPFVKELAKITKPMTASFLTYGAANAKQAKLLSDAGYEIMLHVPMMPHVPAHLAPITLSPEMDKTEIQRELNKMLQRYEGVKLTGVNNHMGSLFTEKTQPMGYVMEVLKQRGMFFLDSKTTSRSVGKIVANKYGVPYIARDVFLDNENDYTYIMGQLRQAERIAKKHGNVVAIGHPHSNTLKALRDWVKDVEQRGFKLVHISELLKN